jgi:AraC-like DNA-binding protein
MRAVRCVFPLVDVGPRCPSGRTAADEDSLCERGDAARSPAERAAPPAPGPATLANTFECLTLQSWIPGRFELSAPWGLRVATPLAWFYLVDRGACVIEAEGQPRPLTATAGDMLIVAQGCAHQLRERVGSPVTAIQELLRPHHFERRTALVHGGAGDSTRLLAGCFRLEGLERSPLHATLPLVMHVRGSGERPAPHVEHILRLVELEATANEPGSRSLIDGLLRVLYLKTLHDHVAQLPEGRASWLKALSDPEIGHALAAIHARPEVPWTVAALAEEVAMARSTFAARFTAWVGEPPLEYLTRWRIQKASLLLRTTRTELKAVATRVGYESASAFSKAFTHWMGTPPGAYRRAAGVAATPADVPPL